jgi:hypothetical protein
LLPGVAASLEAFVKNVPEVHVLKQRVCFARFQRRLMLLLLLLLLLQS